MFCFNGGPGVVLGLAAPRRARTQTREIERDRRDAARAAGTGGQRVFHSGRHRSGIYRSGGHRLQPAGREGKAEQFFGESPDIESMGDFIRLWTTRHQRWLSPKYVCGESYGVFRAAGLAHQLHSQYGMTLSGFIFVSGFIGAGVMPCQVLLPAYTATAHFHKKLPPDLQADLSKALAEAREFMRTEYASVLFQGASLSAGQRARAVAKLSRLTGLSARVVEDNDLRIEPATFRTELLHGEGLILGRFDGRIAGRGGAAAVEADFDPSLSAVDGAFAAAVNAYLRGELKFTDDLPYRLLAHVGPWSHEPRGSVMNDFAAEMRDNPHLRVLVLNGRCDLACPVDFIRYNIDHLKLDPAYRASITYAAYEAGHMMYLNPPDLRKMQKDLEHFVRM